MIKIVFYKSGDSFWGFEETGHSGFAESGEDIVCSAVSAMTMLVINAIETGYESSVDYEIDEKTANVSLTAKGALADYEDDERKRFAISGLLYSYYLQLNELVEEYYDYLEVSMENRTV